MGIDYIKARELRDRAILALAKFIDGDDSLPYYLDDDSFIRLADESRATRLGLSREEYDKQYKEAADQVAVEKN